MLARLLASVILAALPLTVLAAQDSSASPPDLAALLKRLDEQDKRIQALEEQLAAQSSKPSASGGAAVGTETSNIASPATVSPAPGTAAIPVGAAKAGTAGFAVQSLDGENVIRFRGNIAFDGRWYSDNVTPDSQDTWLFRKARPYIEGTVGGIYDFRVMPDFAGGKPALVDAFVAARFAPFFVVQAGKFKAPVGLERLQPDQYNRFVELGLPSSLVPNRDEGVQLGGDIAGGVVSYAIGSFIGVTDGASTDAAPLPDVDNDNGKKDWEGRLFTQPFIASANPYLRGFGAGIAGTYVDFTASAATPQLPSYKTPGQQTFFTYRTSVAATTTTAAINGTYANGQRDRWSPQLFYYVGRVGVLGEYVESSQDVSRKLTSTLTRSGRIDNSAWQASLSYFLTGEAESYNSFAPHSTFRPGYPGWGAWELVARYHELRVDEAAFAGGLNSFADPTVSARAARALGVGLNWYLNTNFKWMFDYERTRFDGGAPNGGDRPDEQAFLTRFNLFF